MDKILSDKVKELKAKGCLYKEIAAETGISHSRINYILNGIDGAGRKYRNYQAEDLKNMKPKKIKLDKKCSCCGYRKVAAGNHFLCLVCEKYESEEQALAVCL